jgi:hypothetical protein
VAQKVSSGGKMIMGHGTVSVWWPFGLWDPRL